MDDLELKSLWQAANARLESQMDINRKLAADITKLKVQGALSRMKPTKQFLIGFGIVWVLFVDLLVLLFWGEANWCFLVSALLQSLLTKLAIGVYVYQIILINQVDASRPVAESQASLAQLRSATLWVARILVLQLPLWTTFHLNGTMLVNGNPALWAFQGLMTLAFTAAAIWLFINIRYENRHERWFRRMFSGREWQPILDSMEMLEELEQYDEEKQQIGA